MTITHKQTKADQIARCASVIGDFFEVPADHIISPLPRKGNRLQNARSLLTYHLYSCGMSFTAICRLLGRSIDTVRRMESAGAIQCMGKAKEIVEGLPRIASTLEITSSVPSEQPADENPNRSQADV